MCRDFGACQRTLRWAKWSAVLPCCVAQGRSCLNPNQSIECKLRKLGFERAQKAQICATHVDVERNRKAARKKIPFLAMVTRGEHAVDTWPGTPRTPRRRKKNRYRRTLSATLSDESPSRPRAHAWLSTCDTKGDNGAHGS